MISLDMGETCTYDANGNMTSRVEGGLTYTQTFNAVNLLVSVVVSGQTTQFVYDGDGNLVKKIKPDGSKTIYVGGVYEVDKTSGGSVTQPSRIIRLRARADRYCRVLHSQRPPWLDQHHHQCHGDEDCRVALQGLGRSTLQHQWHDADQISIH
jgi:YD repeat-containing protein